jgi:hypothetical protein
MAQITASSNIANGNIIQPSDILPLYQAMTSGGGLSLSISGTLTGSATTALNASKLNPLPDTTNANRPLVFVSTSSADYEQTFKANSGKCTYNPSTELLTVTSSFAVTASYAANGGTSNQIIQQQSERLSGGVQDSTFKFICGSTLASLGVATTSAYSLLSGKVLGTNVFVTATINSNSATAGNIVVVKSLSGGALTFNTAGGTGTETIFYQAFILQ